MKFLHAIIVSDNTIKCREVYCTPHSANERFGPRNKSVCVPTLERGNEENPTATQIPCERGSLNYRKTTAGVHWDSTFKAGNKDNFPSVDFGLKEFVVKSELNFHLQLMCNGFELLEYG